MKQLFVNNFATALVGGVAAGDGILSVASATGLPAPGAGQHFLLTLIGLDANGNEVIWEVVKVTTMAGSTLTVSRGQENTAARAWPDGTLIEARLTAGGMDGKEDAIAEGTAEQFWRGDKSWQSILAAVQGTLLTGLNLAFGTVISEADTVLTAMGKLQKQITNAATNLAANVRLTALSGYLLGSNAALANTDTVEGAFGKVQAQLNAKLPLTGGAITGNLSFSGNGRRITGDFGSGVGGFANRTFFQTATANNQTVVSAMPNGTSRIAGFHAFNSGTDLENCSRVAVNVTATDATLQSDRLGTGAYLPLHLAVGAGGIAARFETDGRASLWSDAGGYSGSLTLKNPSGTISRTIRVNNADQAMELVNQANTAITHFFANNGDFRADKSLFFGSGGGGLIGAGCLYSDGNWGVIFRAARANPAIAEFAFQNSSGTNLAYIDRAANTHAFIPGADATQWLGAGYARWSQVFAASGTINTSDAREKTAVAPLSAAELAAAKDLAKEIGTYQWLAALAEKGEGARHHVGMTVQRSIEILQSHGLEPFTYGFICYDQWEAVDPVYAEDGETVMQEGRNAGNRYSFRMDELALFIARGQAQRQDELEARIAALEAGV